MTKVKKSLAKAIASIPENYLIQSPLADIPDRKGSLMPPGCTSGLSSVCSICGSLVVRDVPEIGWGATLSSCGHGHWESNGQHNRLDRDG